MYKGGEDINDEISLSTNICHRAYCKDDRNPAWLSNLLFLFFGRTQFRVMVQSAYLKRHPTHTSPHHSMNYWLGDVNDGAIATVVCLLFTNVVIPSTT